MNVKWWRWMTIVLVATGLMAVGCDELPTDGGGDGDGTPDVVNLVGTWMVYEASINGQPMDPSTVMQFDASGAGTRYDVDSLSANLESSGFSWSINGNTLQVTTNEDPPQTFTITVTVTNSNDITVQYSDGTDTVVEKFVRWTGGLNSTLVGDWNLTSLTVAGTAISPVPSEHVKLYNDGTGRRTTATESDSIRWSVTGDKFLVRDATANAGWGMPFVLSGTDQVTFTQSSSDGQVVMVFSRDTGGGTVDPTIDADLVGTWVSYESTYNGVQEEIEFSIRFNDDGTGLTADWDEYYDSNTGSYYEQPINEAFTWAAANGVLSIYISEGSVLDTMEINYSFTNTNLVAINFTEYDDNLQQDVSVQESLARFRETTQDAAMVGSWIQTERYEDNVSVSPDGEIVELNSDGTGVHYGDGDSGSFFWSAYDGKFVVLPDPAQANGLELLPGFVADYTTSTDQISIETYEEVDDMGTYADVRLVFGPFSGFEQDAALEGTWVVGSALVDGYETPMRETIRFRNDGTATAWYEGYDDATGDTYTETQEISEWKTAAGYLWVTSSDQDGEYTDMAAYEVVNGNQFVLTMEMDYYSEAQPYSTHGVKTTEQEMVIELTYHKITESNPTEGDGRWLLYNMYYTDTGDPVKAEITLDLDAAAGTGTVYQRMEQYDPQQDMHYEQMDTTQFIWSVNDWASNAGTLVQYDTETMLGGIGDLTLSGETMSVTQQLDQNGTMFTQEFQKWAGTNPAGMADTWVSYMQNVNDPYGEMPTGDFTPPAETVILDVTGTGTHLGERYYYDETTQTDTVEYVSETFDWIVSSDGTRFLMLDPSTNLGFVGDINQTGDFFDLTTWGFATTYFVRHTGSEDSNLYGTWNLSEVRRDGVAETNVPSVSMTVNSGGTGSREEPDGSGGYNTMTFSWSTSNGYILVNPDNYPTGFEELRMGLEYSFNASSELVITEYRLEWNETTQTEEIVMVEEVYTPAI